LYIVKPTIGQTGAILRVAKYGELTLSSSHGGGHVTTLASLHTFSTTTGVLPEK